jgi:hypothetical protein
MIGLFWNIRGLGKINRIPALRSRTRDHHVDVVGIMETKKDKLSSGMLNSLTWNTSFNWYHLEAKGSARGILVRSIASDLFLTQTTLIGPVSYMSPMTLFR